MTAAIATTTTTYAKTIGWLERYFGTEGMYVITKAGAYGYGIEVMSRVDSINYQYGVFKKERDKPRVGLGIFDTPDEAVNMLKLLTATEGNDDGNVN